MTNNGSKTFQDWTTRNDVRRRNSRHHGEKYRNTVFKINYVCPILFNFIGRESEGIVGEHLNDLVEIKDGKESAYLFSDALYDSELIDEAERWK